MVRRNGSDRTLYNLGQAPPGIVAHHGIQGGSNHDKN